MIKILDWTCRVDVVDTGGALRIFNEQMATVVGVAQRLEHWTVTPGVGGSNPLAHPIFSSDTL